MVHTTLTWTVSPEDLRRIATDLESRVSDTNPSPVYLPYPGRPNQGIELLIKYRKEREY